MRKIILAGLALIVLGAAGLALFAWSGLYSVAASRGHWPFVHWFLEFGMRKSVETHASGIETPPLSDRALLERGVGHFQGGCAPCHGAPGFPPSPVAQQTLPSPPDLSKAAPQWKPHQLFWIVKHGLKYTGMPAWPAPARDDEVWALVAFLVRLPGIGPDEYRRLALIDDASATNAAQRTSVAGFGASGSDRLRKVSWPARGRGRGRRRAAARGPETRIPGDDAYGLCARHPSQRHHGSGGDLSERRERKQNLADYYGSLGDVGLSGRRSSSRNSCG